MKSVLSVRDHDMKSRIYIATINRHVMGEGTDDEPDIFVEMMVTENENEVSVQIEKLPVISNRGCSIRNATMRIRLHVRME